MRYNEVIGTPLFFLRDVYMEEDGVKDFALVQIIDTFSIQSTGGGLTPSAQLEKYLKEHLGAQLTSLIMGNLKKAGEFNPGVFVAAVEEVEVYLSGRCADTRFDIPLEERRRSDLPSFQYGTGR